MVGICFHFRSCLLRFLSGLGLSIDLPSKCVLFTDFAIRGEIIDFGKLRSEIGNYAQNDVLGVENYALESDKVGSPAFQLGGECSTN